MDASTFLQKHVTGFAELSDEERSEIASFTLLWSAMEGRVVGCEANPTSLLGAVSQMAGAGLLDSEQFAASLRYFSARYFVSNEFTDHFGQLLFRANDRRALVEGVLSGTDVDVEHVVGALLIITWRLRNNLFHGAKWIYGIRDQLGNFTHANDVLMAILERHQG